MTEDTRTGPDERRDRSRGGRRADDRIAELKTHKAKYVSVTAAIDYINRECGGVSRQTFYKWIRTGALKTERGVTRKIIIRTDTLRLFLLNRLHRPA